MANRTLNTRLRLKYDTAANWATKNPVLLAGEVGIESDTLLGKVGDGEKTWQQLEYLKANKVNSNLIIKLNNGATEGTNLFTFNGSVAKTINITPSAIGAAASSHNHDDKYLGKAAKAADSDKLDGKDSTYYLNKITALEGKPGLDKVGTITSIKANGTSFNPDSTGKVDLGNIGGGSGPLQFSDTVVMTEAEFSEAYLAGTLQDDKLYLIEGETGTVNFVSTADHIVYSNTNSGLTATNLQDAVDEMCQRLLTTEQLNKLVALLNKITIANDSITFNTIVKAITFDVQ